MNAVAADDPRRLPAAAAEVATGDDTTFEEMTDYARYGAVTIR